MKRAFVILFAFLLISSVRVFAQGEIEVLAAMNTASRAQDKVWVGTFQLAWNDFMNKIVHEPVYFLEGTPTIVKVLNSQTLTTEDISNKNYYKITDKVSPKARKKIEKNIKKKFNQESDILRQLDWTFDKNKYIIYAMLKKDFLFLNEFDKLEQNKFGKEQIANYFGVSSNSDKTLREGIDVLYYNTKDDFAIKLTTKSEDEVYLYKCKANKSFKTLYSDMFRRTNVYRRDIKFKSNDELKIPYIKFFEEKSFDELTNRRVKGTTISISQALETIEFIMDNKGVELNSETVITTANSSLNEDKPRQFYLDDTFVIFLKEKKSQTPYFALRVNDITKFQK